MIANQLDHNDHNQFVQQHKEHPQFIANIQSGVAGHHVQRHAAIRQFKYEHARC